MPKFNRKPKQVEARQFTGGQASATEITNWVNGRGGVARWWEGRVAETESGGQSVMPEEMHLETPRGLMIAKPGDWIVRNPDGDFYPSKPEIFELKYDAA